MSETQTAHESSAWKRSTFCSESSCVEVALSDGSAIGLRDSKLSHSPVLTFTAEEWTAFVRGVKNGEFDLA